MLAYNLWEEKIPVVMYCQLDWVPAPLDVKAATAIWYWVAALRRLNITMLAYGLLVRTTDFLKYE